MGHEKNRSPSAPLVGGNRIKRFVLTGQKFALSPWIRRRDSQTLLHVRLSHCDLGTRRRVDTGVERTLDLQQVNRWWSNGLPLPPVAFRVNGYINSYCSLYRTIFCFEKARIYPGFRQRARSWSSGFDPSPLPFIPLSSVRAPIWFDEGQLSSRCTSLHRLHPRHPVRHRAPHRCPFLDPLQSNFERPAA
jgi:hypothetical protein